MKIEVSTEIDMLKKNQAETTVIMENSLSQIKISVESLTNKIVHVETEYQGEKTRLKNLDYSEEVNNIFLND